MPGSLRVNARLEIPEAELSWRFSRSSGPGGQHVNTSDSRVELSFDLEASPTIPAHLKERATDRLGSRLVDGVVTISASDGRSQWKNRSVAEARMADLLREAFAPPKPPRRATKPTRSSQRVRVDDKKRRGEVKKARRRPGSDD